MPHVVIEAAGDLQALYQAFNPIIQRTGDEILKVQEFYLSRSGKESAVITHQEVGLDALDHVQGD